MKTLVGNKIRMLRDMKGYSQEDMAREMNITASAYSKLERDETDIKLNQLVQIAKILGVDAQTILNFDEKQIFNFHNSHQNTVGNREAHVYHNDKLIEVLQTQLAHSQSENTRLIDIIANMRGTG